jgi:hypothetical protein
LRYEDERYLHLPRLLSTSTFHSFLHRYFASIIQECCKYPHHVSALSDLIESLGNQPDGSSQLTSLADHPLLAALFASQIRVGMWRRNGAVMTDQLMNYADPPFARVYRDFDMLTMQFASIAAASGAETLVAHIFCRYGVLEYLSQRRYSVGTSAVNRGALGTVHKRDEIFLPALLEESLLLIINLVTEVPLPPSDDISARSIPVIRRELIHRLAGSPATFSQLQESLNAINDHSKLPPADVERFIYEIADRREQAPLSLEPPLFHLKKELWCQYDPAYPRMLQRAHQQAMEARPAPPKDKPTAMAPALPDPHPCFARFRESVMFNRTLLRALRSLLLVATAQRTSLPQYDWIRRHWTLQCNSAEYSRAVHLITLFLHVACSTVEPAPSENEAFKSSSRVVELFLLDEEVIPSTEATDADEEEGEPKEDSGAGGADVKLPHLLRALLDLHDATDPVHDACYRNWLGWIIEKSGELHPSCANVIQATMNDKNEETRRKQLEEKKRLARERAMKAMQKSASKFAAHMVESGETSSGPTIDASSITGTAAGALKDGAGRGVSRGSFDSRLSTEDGSEVGGESAPVATDADADAAPSCIVCQCAAAASSYDLGAASTDIGYLAFSQLSRIGDGAQSPWPASEDPIHLEDSRLKDSGDDVDANVDADADADLHLSFCGHAMHFSCFDSYLATVMQRSEAQGGLILDTERGQFQCPLCKRLNNMLLPIQIDADPIGGRSKSKRKRVQAFATDCCSIESESAVVMSEGVSALPPPSLPADSSKGAQSVLAVGDGAREWLQWLQHPVLLAQSRWCSDVASDHTRRRSSSTPREAMRALAIDGGDGCSDERYFDAAEGGGKGNADDDGGGQIDRSLNGETDGSEQQPTANASDVGSTYVGDAAMGSDEIEPSPTEGDGEDDPHQEQLLREWIAGDSLGGANEGEWDDGEEEEEEQDIDNAEGAASDNGERISNFIASVLSPFSDGASFYPELRYLMTRRGANYGGLLDLIFDNNSNRRKFWHRYFR